MDPLSSKLAASAIVELLKVLVPFIHQNVKSFAWGFKDDLEKLGKTLEGIQGVMVEAEKRQITDIPVQNWLNDLRDIAYDVEDVLDDFAYLVMGKSIKDWKNKVRDSVSSNNPLHLRFKIARQIKDINKRLEKIQEHKVMFQLPNFTAPPIICVTDIRKTTSYIQPDDSLIGRDNDKLEIVKLLTSSPSDQFKELPVIPIVGMGGVGKSTLLHNLFAKMNQSGSALVKEGNRKKADPVTLEMLSRELHENLRGRKFLLVLDDLWNEDAEAWRMLKNPLTSAGTKGSKIIITTRKERVASTVRGMIDPYFLKQLNEGECWSIITKRAFAAGGATETPRMVDIGKQIAGKCGGLPLVARTLGSLMHTKNTLTDWQSIAEDDVFNIEEDHSKIISILKLSYDNLTSQLKRCFSYCCIFPKDFAMERKNLINLWMAEGFIQPTGDGNSDTMEYIGSVCFNHLLQSSFFQDVKMDKFGGVHEVKMHDLIHDLARHVLDDYECSVSKTGANREYNSKGRRIQVAFDDDGEISPLFRKSLTDAKKLRTIFAIQGNSWHIPIEMFLANKRVRVLYVMFRVNIGKCLASISKLRHLRYLNLTMAYSSYHKFSPDEYLDLSLNRAITGLFHLETLVLRYSGIKNLPEDIGSLKKLRHLDLGFNLALEELPDSITCLSNLQTLNLNECYGLKCLPEDIGALKHLRYLNLGGTRIEGLPESITDCCNLEMLDIHECEIEALPRNIGDLKSLKCLDISFNRNIEELPITFGALNELTFFDFTETRIKELPESCDNGLSSLIKLKESADYWYFKEVKNWMNSVKHNNGTVDLRDDRSLPSRIRDIVSHLNLNTYTFSVRRNKGIGDLGEVNLLGGKLVILDLQNVRGGAAEARRANLILKEKLSVLSLQWDYRYWNNSNLQTHIEATQVLEELQPHPNLRELSIENFPGVKLPSWLTGNDFSPSLPNLVEIQLIDCSGCEQILGLGLLPSLKKLILFHLYSLKEWAETTPTVSPGTCYYPALQELEIIRCPDLKLVPTSTFPSLKKLDVHNINEDGLCSLLRNNLTSLTEVFLSFGELKFLPVEIWQPSLESLEVFGSGEFQGFGWTKEESRSCLCRMTSLRKLMIYYSEEWNPFKDLQYLPNLEELELDCYSVADGSASASTSASASLPAEADELEAESIQNLISLRSLSIHSRSKGNSLPRHLEHLSGLRLLTISGFHGLVVLPEWLRNFSSLERLNVFDCPQLKRSYADKEGEEYQKISHIKDILFRQY